MNENSKPNLVSELNIGETNADDPRICILSGRNFSHAAFQCVLYEAQDVLCESPNVDLICLEKKTLFDRWEKLQRRLMYKDFTGKLAYINPGLQEVQLRREYDLLIVICATYRDSLQLNAIKSWKKFCKKAVCWIDELYAAAVPAHKYWLQSLDRFDQVILGLQGTVDVMSKAIGRRCHYVPTAVDSLRFCPFPAPPSRVVDIYSIGRRTRAIHEALLRLAAENRMFYVFDTLHNGESQAKDHIEHRNLFASIAQRSRFFMVAPGKINLPRETAGQIEVAARYFEGLAAGAVLLGESFTSDKSKNYRDWSKGVIEIRSDGSDVADVIQTLTADPERLEELSRRNVIHALLHHDWLYRWRQILEIAGIRATRAMRLRERRLHQMAALIRQSNAPVFSEPVTGTK